MRRKDREITDRDAINKIIGRCKVCRIAMCDDGQPYVIPVFFGYDGSCFYLHSANTGKKIDIIKKNNRVGFEFDILHEIINAEIACEWSARYESVVGTGLAEFIYSHRERSEALECILRQYGGSISNFKGAALDSTTIIRVTIVSISGKRKK